LEKIAVLANKSLYLRNGSRYSPGYH